MQHINYRYSIVKTLDSFAECDSYIVKDAFDNRQYHATLINSAQHSFLSLIKRNYRMLLQLSHEFINPPFRFEKVFFCDDYTRDEVIFSRFEKNAKFVNKGTLRSNLCTRLIGSK